MLPNTNYFERCHEVADKLRNMQIDDREPGIIIGIGRDMKTVTLGALALGSQECFLAIKSQRLRSYSDDLKLALAYSISVAALIQDQAPAFAGHIPAFVCGLRLTSSPVGTLDAMITEDVSRDNSLTVCKSPLSSSSKKRLYDAFANFGAGQEVFEEESLNNMTFVAGVNEYFLDFTPSPFRQRELLNDYLTRAFKLINEETVTVIVDSDSRLGNYLQPMV